MPLPPIPGNMYVQVPPSESTPLYSNFPNLPTTSYTNYTSLLKARGFLDAMVKGYEFNLHKKKVKNAPLKSNCVQDEASNSERKQSWWLATQEEHLTRGEKQLISPLVRYSPLMYIIKLTIYLFPGLICACKVSVRGQ